MNRRAFTLIELLIVVTIIGILAVALVPRIVGGSASARDARRQTDVQTIATGLEYYLSENGDFDDIGGGTVSGATFCADTLSADLSDSIGSIPSDPSDNNGNIAFGDDCIGGYVVMFMEDTSANVTKYAIAALMELPEVGDDFVYNAPANESTYAGFAPDDYDAIDDGYFIVY